MLGGDIFDRFTDGVGRKEASTLGGVEIVGGAVDALGGGPGAFAFRNLEHPADEFGVGGELIIGIGDQNTPLLLDGRWLLLVGLGLDDSLHFSNDLAEHLGIHRITFHDLGDLVNINFRHGRIGFFGPRKGHT